MNRNEVIKSAIDTLERLGACGPGIRSFDRLPLETKERVAWSILRFDEGTSDASDVDFLRDLANDTDGDESTRNLDFLQWLLDETDVDPETGTKRPKLKVATILDYDVWADYFEGESTRAETNRRVLRNAIDGTSTKESAEDWTFDDIWSDLPEATIESIVRIVARLRDYGVASDDVLSSVESAHTARDWERYGRAEFRSAIETTLAVRYRKVVDVDDVPDAAIDAIWSDVTERVGESVAFNGDGSTFFYVSVALRRVKTTDLAIAVALVGATLDYESVAESATGDTTDEERSQAALLVNAWKSARWLRPTTPLASMSDRQIRLLVSANVDTKDGAVTFYDSVAEDSWVLSRFAPSRRPMDVVVARDDEWSAFVRHWESIATPTPTPTPTVDRPAHFDRMNVT